MGEERDYRKQLELENEFRRAVGRWTVDSDCYVVDFLSLLRKLGLLTRRQYAEACRGCMYA